MADERHEYEALTAIDDPATQRTAYRPGQGIHASVVEAWGLRVGAHDDEQAQVVSLRPGSMARPAANATRDEWLRYRMGQPGADREALDGMGRNDLRDLDAEEQPGEEDTAVDTADERDTKQPAGAAGTKKAKE